MLQQLGRPGDRDVILRTPPTHPDLVRSNGVLLSLATVPIQVMLTGSGDQVVAFGQPTPSFWGRGAGRKRRQSVALSEAGGRARWHGSRDWHKLIRPG